MRSSGVDDGRAQPRGLAAAETVTFGPWLDREPVTDWIHGGDHLFVRQCKRAWGKK